MAEKDKMGQEYNQVLPGELREREKGLDPRQLELLKLSQISRKIAAGFTLEEVMQSIYLEFREVIPYDRMGLALINQSDATVSSRWSDSDSMPLHLPAGYSAPLKGSSLEKLLRSNKPRILNNLLKYLQEKPESNSTQLIVDEGIRSSLTCPLIADGKAIGFLFFSSKQERAYADVHVEIFQLIAEQVSILVQKACLVSELIAQKAELERLNALKNSFLGMAAHDLRGPACTVKAVTELLLDEEMQLSSKEASDLLDAARRQCARMLSLIDGLLDVNKIENGKLDLHLEQVELNLFLEDAVASYNRLSLKKHIQIVLGPVMAKSIYADPMRLNQILDNLVFNAIKFSPVNSTVEVWVEDKVRDVCFFIKDQGPGLTEEDKKAMFGEFVRLSAKPTAGEKSSGLGLAIAKRLVKEHGGVIGVDSQEGQGAAFWFTIPKLQKSSKSVGAAKLDADLN